MKSAYFCCIVLLLFPLQSGFAQITEAFDDFEGNSNITEWVEDNCDIDASYSNPFVGEFNPSPTVLRYQDTGGQYANVRFQMEDNFDLSTKQTFSIKIYIPSNGITGTQPNQVSLKLQNGLLSEPWITQSEIIKPVTLNTWQTVTFNFEKDNFINLDAGSIAPTLRDDFNRVVIQVNGENNTDHVLAYIDDLKLYQAEDDTPNYNQLVWSDEFEIDGAPDSEKWYFQTQLPQGDSWYNGEIQHYTDRLENTVVEDGVLKIRAKRETFSDQGVTKLFTSARLNSKFAFTYGKVEVRAKLPFGVGTWPAIWLLGKNIIEDGAYWESEGFGTEYWPACGEIDIMEHWGQNQNYVSSAIHTPSSFGGTVNHGGQVIPNVSSEFHTYTLLWTEDKMEFSVDGVRHYTYDPEIKNNDTWPFDLEQYILFNVAILPNISPDFIESAMEIDYIRVYQEGISTATEETNENVYSVYPNPFEDEINVHIGKTAQTNVKVSIFDLSGSLTKEITGTIHQDTLRIDQIGRLPSGTYVFQFFINGKVQSFKAVKK